MGKIRPVRVEFKLSANKIIPFSVIQNTAALQSDEEPEYGYAADIAFLDLYADEVSHINIPIITYSKLKDFDQWKDSLTNLKASVLNWNNTVRPIIQNMPADLSSKSDLMKNKLDDVIVIVGDILEALNDGRQDPEPFIKQFNSNMSALSDRSNKAAAILEEFHTTLKDHSTRLENEGKLFVTLSQKVTDMTAEQKKQLEDLTAMINDYESKRNAYIAGAAVTGVLGTAFLVGGIAAITFIPGGGLVLGIACFFGAGISYAGMGICIDEAIALKKAIESKKNEQTNVENEKMTLGLIGGQFDNFAARTGDLTAAVDDIWDNWKYVSTALNNIVAYASHINNSKPDITYAEWNDVLNDLNSVSAILKTLQEAINTMELKTQIFTDCDLQNCTTQEEIMAKLKEYWEEKTKNSTAG